MPVILSAPQTEILDTKINLSNIFKLRKTKIELLAASFDFYITWTCIYAHIHVLQTHQERSV